jgi:hypothetical protein
MPRYGLCAHCWQFDLVADTDGPIVKRHLSQIPSHLTAMGHIEESSISATFIQISATGGF